MKQTLRAIGFAFVSVAMLSTAACAPTPKPQATSEAAEAPAQPSAEQQESDCKAKGGILQPVCRLGRVTCIVKFSDAGKACTDGSQCESQKCLADVTGPRDPNAPVSGQCKATNDPCGCSTPVEDGKLGVGVCID